MDKAYFTSKCPAVITKGLNDDLVTEIYRNDDGSVWITHQNHGHLPIGFMNESTTEVFVKDMAFSCQDVLNEDKPVLDGFLPFNGERINVTMPPVTNRICFNIRKKALRIYSLTNYEQQGILSSDHKHYLQKAIRSRKNILVSGAPGSGKTTFCNALIEAISTLETKHRLVILQDVPELQSNSKNVKSMLTTEQQNLGDLIWIAMRSLPDRIIVGEVRDRTVYSMLKAFNTGCKGGLATIHANSAEATYQRVIDLASEMVSIPPYNLILETLHVIVHIGHQVCDGETKRAIQIIETTGFDRTTQRFQFIQH